jgi:anti-repressor protein
MNELMKIEEVELDGQEIKTVNARDLHSFLEVPTRFNDWIKRRIEDFDFMEGADFVVLKNEYVTEYHLTLDMAKELSMVERNKKGKQARQYFIECERRAKSLNIRSILDNPEALQSALLTYTSKVIELKSQVHERDKLIENIGPKAAIADRIHNADGLHGLRETAKMLHVNERKFSSWLRVNKWIHANGKPHGMAEKVRLGHIYHRIELKTVDGEDRTQFQMFFTPKGVATLTKIFNENPQIDFDWAA